jgi:hypothetical protein
MYDTIIDPITSNSYNIYSFQGRALLKSYISLYQQGGTENSGESHNEDEDDFVQSDTFRRVVHQVILSLNEKLQKHCQNIELRVLFQNDPIPDKLCVFNGPIDSVGDDGVLVSIHTWEPVTSDSRPVCMSSVMIHQKDKSPPGIFEIESATSHVYQKLQLNSLLRAVVLIVISKFGPHAQMKSFALNPVSAWTLRKYIWSKIIEEDNNEDTVEFVNDSVKKNEILARAQDCMKNKNDDVWMTTDVEIFINASQNVEHAMEIIQNIANNLPDKCPQFTKHIKDQIEYEEQFEKLMRAQ